MRPTRLTLLAAAALVCASAPAFAAPPAPPATAASALSLASPGGSRIGAVRAGKPLRNGNALSGSNGLGIALLAVVGAGAAWAAYEMIKGDDDDNPASP
jgi:hypothetical protein